MKINYKIRTNSIIFGRGSDIIEVDEKNNNFTNLGLIMSNYPKKRIIISLNNNFKSFLIVLKSIFYSKVNQINVILINPNEVHKHILSKIFDFNKLIKEGKFKKVSYQKYFVRSKLKNFDYRYSIISITKKISKNKIQSDLKLSPKLSKELIYVVNEKIQFKNIFKNVKIIVFKPSKDLRFNISKKKNLGIKYANGKILIIKHDRIKITSKWLKKLSKFNNFFDMYTCKITSKSYRFLDKVAYQFNDYLFNSPRSYYLTYSEKNDYQYMDGGLFVLNNKRFYKEKIFDERLNWLELEDVDFITKTKLDCNLITFDKNNYLISDFKDHFKLSNNPFTYLYKSIIRRFINPY